MELTFRTYSLSNGMTLITKENRHVQSVVMRGRLNGGANLDPPDKAGLASFTTMMMRRGTANHTFAEINEAVEAVGASLHIHCGRHMLTIGCKSLAEDVDLLIGLIAECLTSPTFPHDEIERVRGQVVTGLRVLEESPRGLAHLHFREILYGADHPYGRPFSGTLETIPEL